MWARRHVRDLEIQCAYIEDELRKILNGIQAWNYIANDLSKVLNETKAVNIWRGQWSDR